MGKFIDRTGEENYNNFGSKMIIKKYRGAADIDIYFPKYDCVVKNMEYRSFIRGQVKCPYEPRVYNIGFEGQGKHKIMIEKEKTNKYKTWISMMGRCYNTDYLKKEPSYIDCYVDKTWHNFQNFGEWYDKNFYKVENQNMQLDKDILCKGNKIYSPENCVFVPQRINSLFVKRQNDRGKYPIGVTYDKTSKKYLVQCCNKYSKQMSLGYYNTSEEGFYVYKQFKEKVIKQIAEDYKNLIPQKLYNVLHNYEVEIDD